MHTTIAYINCIALILESSDSAEAVLQKLDLNSQQISLSINKKTKVDHFEYYYDILYFTTLRNYISNDASRLNITGQGKML